MNKNEEEILDSTDGQEPEAVQQPEQTKDQQAEPKDDQTGLEEKVAELQEKLLRMAAEYDNFRKRSQRERDSSHAEAVAYAVKALLPTYDNLERALKTETIDAEYKKGVELTMAQLIENLKGIGVVQVDAAVGAAFDPNYHNAVMHIESEDFGENVIAEVFQQGFCIGDKVIRHAMVQVAN